MRIVGGQCKGRRIKVAKKGTRPTRGKVRKAIFDILDNNVVSADVLDIFAGSGALGIEAISRGAEYVTFIEKNPRILFENIKNFSLIKKTKVVINDFRLGLKHLCDKKFDVIFADPPYKKGYIQKTLDLILKYALLKKRGIIILEHSPYEEFILPNNLCIIKKKIYGNTMVTFITENRAAG